MITVLVRIGLYVIAGWFIGQGFDSDIVDYIKTDPEVLGGAVAIVSLIWWRLAKKFGWET